MKPVVLHKVAERKAGQEAVFQNKVGGFDIDDIQAHVQLNGGLAGDFL
jgi:hypothetical protein